MFKARVKDIKKEYSQTDGTRFLDVFVEVLKDDKVVELRRFAFGLDKKSKEVKNEIDKFVKTLNSDAKQAEKQSVLDAQDKEADKTIAELKGKLT